MPHLQWERFEELPGDPRENWEILCREAVRRQYEQYGLLLTRRQQPGVEFHLEVQKEESSLGQVGTHWGWQCKWYERQDLKRDGSLRAHQKRSIEEAIGKSAAHVESLTDWTLWTREKLTAADLRWFKGLRAPFVLRHWDEETLAGLLSGAAEPLRATWFGELILDSEILTQQRREALAPIRQRYVEELHVRTPPEQKIEEVLLGPRFAEELGALEVDLDFSVGALRSCREDAVHQGAALAYETALGALTEMAIRFVGLSEYKQEGRIPAAPEVEELARRATEVEASIARLDRALDGSEPVATPMFEARTVIRNAKAFLARLVDALRIPLMVVLGGAGAGKTHMSASVTGPDDIARGALLLGRQFGAEIGDDDLARHAGLGSSRDELLEALEALGLREGRRVPLVIDGINESEDPSAWQVVLARLADRLSRLDHVFAVVTVRPTYRALALPPDLPSVELLGLVGKETEAIRRYFDYYKIDASPQTIDWWRPSDPLLLSIFCRTVNPSREATVGAADLPASLTEVLDAYLKAVCSQIALTMKIPPEEIEAALLHLASCFYRHGERELARDEVSEALGDSRRARWKESLRFQLEAEGILIRDVVGHREMVLWSYDLLAGHAIARSLLLDDLPGLLADPEALERHPLREDIVTGLVGSLGSRSGELITAFAGRPDLVFDVIQAHVRLPAELVGQRVLDELRQLFEQRPQDVLEALESATLRPRHPLNATVLDLLLHDLPMWKRDLAWTAWMQGRSWTSRRVTQLSGEWRLGTSSEDDDAALHWLTWVLTSSSEELRQSVVLALSRLGRLRPTMLFDRTLKMLSISDPTVGEGLLAAAYGVVMSAQDPSPETRAAILAFAGSLRDRVFGSAAAEQPSHWLVREYAHRIMQFASWLSNGQFEAPSTATQPPIERAIAEELPANLMKEPLRGEVSREVRRRIATMGWRRDRFQEVEGGHQQGEDLLDFDASRRDFRAKYARTALHEAHGQFSLFVEALPERGWRIAEPSLDPSFPISGRVPNGFLPKQLTKSGENQLWLEGIAKEVPPELLRPPGEDGERWVAIDGRLSCHRHGSPRRVDCRITGLLALDGWEEVAAHFSGSTGRRSVPELPVSRRCFLGEAPWSPTFDGEATDASGVCHPHVCKLGRDENGPKVELLALDFIWNPSHSTFNTADIGSIPAKFFSQQLGLRKIPDLPEFVDAHGRAAAHSFSFRGFSHTTGHLLYVREDLLETYLDQRGGEWGWVVDGRHVRASSYGQKHDGKESQQFLHVIQTRGAGAGR